MEKRFIIASWLCLALLVACRNNSTTKNHPAEGFSSKVILEWNQAIIEAMGGVDYEHVLLSARIHAMMHIAMHDALNAIYPVYETYAFKGDAKEADPVAAAASAAHTVLTASFPEKKAMLDEALTQSLASVSIGKKRNNGIAIGIEAANAILANRKDDGAFSDPVGVISNPLTPALYQYVPPFDFVFAPQWKTMQTFALTRYDQFRCAPPAILTSDIYTRDFNEVKNIGGKESKTRTPEQTAIAKFWYEASEIGWNRIARIIVEKRELDMLSTARLFALLNIALADAYTAGFDAKYYYDFWRPYTAIRAAETDNNAATSADPNWEPGEITPPVQDYPSTHSALGNAGAEVLALLLGDATSFTTESSTADSPGATRSFSSFSQAANENAESRVLAGIHFRFSCQAGQEMGRKIGKWTVEKYLRPVYGED